MKSSWAGAVVAAISIGVAVAIDRPIIAVVSHPAARPDEPCSGECEYLAASYVKWIESAGGRAVRMPYNITAAEAEDLLSQVNGLLLPGGEADLPAGVRHAINHVVEMNAKGDFFPLWGTCLGLEWLAMALSGDDSTIEAGYDASNINYALVYTRDARWSKLVRQLPPRVRAAMELEALTFNSHSKGLSPQTYAANQNLQRAMHVISINYDRQNKPFVSAMEGNRSNFEFGTLPDGSPMEAINHSEMAVASSWHLARAFMHFARKNDHTFRSPAEEAAALLSTQPTTQIFAPKFMETYVFTAGADDGGAAAAAAQQQRQREEAIAKAARAAAKRRPVAFNLRGAAPQEALAVA
ncbi:putative gamma-glutamyl hydrolase [Tribonema minus]|uniref:folate gamma-glutamyl hydrolase n=1 Tax=Tribonema minus TaxID=303371 RepID=A0A836C9J3_9STRA|nr:putative gamma-glutamyl hydrolase [Tribonema minus]